MGKKLQYNSVNTEECNHVFIVFEVIQCYS